VTTGQGPGQFPSVGFLPAGGTFRQRQNLNQARSIGLEASVQTPLPHGFSLEARYAFAAATVRDAGAFSALADKRLAQSPRHQAFSRLRWQERLQRFGAALSLEYTSSAFEDDLNTRLLPNALVVGASLEYRWQALSLRAGVDNLFDEQVVSALSADGLITRTRVRSFFLRAQLAY
jgi:vitamin B12 transporter